MNPTSPDRVPTGEGISFPNPFRHLAFAVLWSATLVSNIGTWMQSAAAGWFMTDLDARPFMVSLVQVATSLPMFILAIPAGALGDIFDRRKIIIVVQSVLTTLIVAFIVMIRLNAVTARALLAFALLAASTAAVVTPVWQAIVPQLVPKPLLRQAVALNSVGVNVSRAVGPSLAGIVIAAWGIAAPFWLNAISNIAVIAALVWWNPQETNINSNAPAERILPAIGVGLRYARHNPHLRATQIRALGFFVFASAYWALLPLVARDQVSGGPALFGLLLGGIGVGAVSGASVLPFLQKRLGTDHLVSLGAVGTSIALVLFAVAQHPAAACAASLVAGFSWIIVLTTLNVSTQVALPGWVRGRGLSIYYTVMFGSMTLGSATWGAIASSAGLQTAHLSAALGLIATAALLHPWKLQTGAVLDLTPSGQWPAPVATDLAVDRGPVLVTVEYQVASHDRESFLSAIRHLAGERRRDGAFEWQIFEDASKQGRFVEVFMLVSWAEHLRQHERVTNADRKMQELVNRFQVQGSPKVSHLIAS
jgi:predicted MFS family arabinose efflux permease